MKNRNLHLMLAFAALWAAGAPARGADAVNETSAEFPHRLSFETGDTDFAPGDRITIERVSGTGGVLATGQTICVQGTYNLDSHDEAELALFSTGLSGNPTKVDPRQTVRIRRGAGSFRLIKTLSEEGYLHVSFYPVPSGSSFGGIYFGQGDWVLRNHDYHPLQKSASPSGNAGGGTTTVSLSGPNRALFEYLGNPVEAPANLDPAYTKDGLMQAIQRAAREAGVTVKSVQIEDSEFPFLIGLVCEENDFTKLKEQIRRTERYEYPGSVSSHTHYAFNIVPYRAFPPQDGERIGRRLTVRQRMLFDRISRESPAR